MQRQSRCDDYDYVHVVDIINDAGMDETMVLMLMMSVLTFMTMMMILIMILMMMLTMILMMILMMMLMMILMTVGAGTCSLPKFLAAAVNIFCANG